MKILTDRERQITERKHGTRICPLTAIVNEPVTRGIIHGDDTIKLFVCGYNSGTARYGIQSEIAESRARTPCPLAEADRCELYLAHLGTK